MSAMCSTSTRPLARSVAPDSHEIDDPAAEAEPRRQLHRAVELDALRLDAAGREMPARHVRILGGHPHVAPARGIVARRQRPPAPPPPCGRARCRGPAARRFPGSRTPSARRCRTTPSWAAPKATKVATSKLAHTRISPSPRLRGREAELAGAVVRECRLRLDFPARASRGPSSRAIRPLGSARSRPSLMARTPALPAKPAWALPGPGRGTRGVRSRSTPRRRPWNRSRTTVADRPGSATMPASLSSRAGSVAVDPAQLDRAHVVEVDRRLRLAGRAAPRPRGSGARRWAAKRLSAGSKAISPTAKTASSRHAEITARSPASSARSLRRADAVNDGPGRCRRRRPRACPRSARSRDRGGRRGAPRSRPQRQARR